MKAVISEREAELVGTSRTMVRARRLIAAAAAVETPVLITGEPGTGKELTARAIHFQSRRGARPFVVVPGGSVLERLREPEVFDTASREARGGTVFLDGVAALSPRLQARLLDLLSPGPREREGDVRPRLLPLRLIAAAEGDLEGSARAGRFNRDLLERLRGLSIHLPALRERRTDITLLADHFLRIHAGRQEKQVVRISAGAVELLTGYPWPGNVRELEDAISRAVSRTGEGVIRAQHLPAALQTGQSTGTVLRGSLAGLLAAYEREILLEAIQNAGGNQARAARALSTTPRILAYRLRKHGLHPARRDGETA